jgi:hypothetical protein
MIKVSVMYPNNPGVQFDHDYYRDKHLPLIKRRMGAALNFTDVTPVLQISEVVVENSVNDRIEER